jgi:hypothetical protein
VTSRIRAIALAGAVSAFIASAAAVHGDVQSGDSRTGTWSIQSATSQSEIQLSLTYQHDGDTDQDSYALPLDAATFPGLTMTEVRSGDGQAHFRIVRDPGTFVCDGVFKGGQGAGLFTFVKSDAFAAALEARGLGSISADDQFSLAMNGFSLSTVDLLRSMHVSGLSAGVLKQLGDHGVDDAYIRALVAQGVTPASIDDYIRLRDHGVDAAFVSGLAADGYHPDIDDLVRLQDHGVTLDFIAKLKAHGYTPSIDDLIRLRDAGM